MKSQLLIAFLAMVMLHGCKPVEQPVTVPESKDSPAILLDPQPAPPGQSESQETSSAADLPNKNITLQSLKWEEIQTVIKQQAGKVTVVDLWATYCPPCVSEFPELVKLHEQHSDEVACISVSLDWDGLEDSPIEDSQQKVLKFLTQQEATFTNILCTTDLDTLYREKLEHASLPVVYVYNRKGALVGQFPDPKDPSEFTYQADVLPLVQKLISAP